MTDVGLLERRRSYYLAQIGLHVAAFAAIWAAFFLIGNSWFQLLLAAALGIIVTQFGFLGHDAAHKQIFTSSAWNAWTARILAGAFAGLSFAWWRTKHNRHHTSPNREGVDPDIGPGAIAFTPDIVAQRRAPFAAWFVKRQGWLFFPLLTLEGLNLHAESLRAVLDKRSTQPWRRLEFVIVTSRLTAYVAVLVTFLPIGKAAAFLAIQMATFGFCLGVLRSGTQGNADRSDRTTPRLPETTGHRVTQYPRQSGARLASPTPKSASSRLTRSSSTT